MSDSNLPPEQWRPLFDTIGIDFGYRPLATHIGMNHTRLRRLLLGGGTTEVAIRQVADAFRVPVAKVRELRGEAAVDREPFTLPDDAGRLNERERDVVRSMVRVLLEAKEQSNAVRTDTTETPPAGTSTQGRPPEEGNVVRPAHWGGGDNPPLPPALTDPGVAASQGEKGADAETRGDNADEQQE